MTQVLKLYEGQVVDVEGAALKVVAIRKRTIVLASADPLKVPKQHVLIHAARLAKRALELMKGGVAVDNVQMIIDRLEELV